MQEGRTEVVMDSGLYIAASGMLAEQVRQDQLANDLANTSTPGYKPDTATQHSFGALLLENTATRKISSKRKRCLGNLSH